MAGSCPYPDIISVLFLVSVLEIMIFFTFFFFFFGAGGEGERRKGRREGSREMFNEMNKLEYLDSYNKHKRSVIMSTDW